MSDPTPSPTPGPDGQPAPKRRRSPRKATPPEPTPPPLPPGDTSTLHAGRLVTLGGFLLLGAVVLVLLWKLGRAGGEARVENLALREQLEDALATAADLQRAEQLRREEEQVKRSDLRRSATVADEAERALAALEGATAAWQRTTAELATNDQGKAIAASEEALAQYRALQAAERPDPTLPAALRARFAPLREFLDKALASEDGSYAPSEDLVARIEAVRAEATAAAAVYEDHNRKLAALVASTPAAAGDGTPTLEVALRQLEERLAAEEAALVSAAVEEARKERAEALARAQAETERLVTAERLKAEEMERGIKLDELRARQEAARQQAAAEAREREEAQRRVELERRFEAALPEIQALLRPFITDGNTQPVGRSFKRSTTRGKVSFSALQGGGLLDDSVESARNLFNGMVPNRQNDREMGAFPGMETRGDWIGQVVRAQQLLREFGPLLVEKGMLAP